MNLTLALIALLLVLLERQPIEGGRWRPTSLRAVLASPR
jgi:hypothetical protein